MKKIIVFGVLVMCAIVSYGLGYDSRFQIKQLKNNQKESYQMLEKDRPDSTYNPMHLGDKWWFSVVENEITNIYPIREVVDTLTIDGFLYYKMWGAGLGPNYWIRNNGDTVLVYDQYDVDNNPSTHDLVNNDFTMTSPGVIYPISLTDSLEAWDCFPGSSWQSVIFNFQTTFRNMTYHYAPVVDSWTTWTWARFLGLVGYTSEGVSGTLVACKINNIVYGDSSIVGIDETFPINKVSISNYPNPFNNITTIIFDLKNNRQSMVLEIFNVKGQIIKTLVNGNIKAGSHSFQWNGKDKSGKPVSSGVYFYRLVTSEKCLTNKMLLLK